MDTNIVGISDFGVLAAIAYSNFNSSFIQESFQDGVPITSTEDNLFTLNSSFTVMDYASTNTDMQALLLKKNGKNEYVIAFRGTQEKFDIGVDAIIGLANYNPQFKDAKTFVQDIMTTHNISASDLTLTGHSLGGILTQSVGAVLGIKGCAFNPYGTERLLTMPPNGGGLAGALVSVGIYQVLNAFGLESSYADFPKKIS